MSQKINTIYELNTYYYYNEYINIVLKFNISHILKRKKYFDRDVPMTANVRAIV